MGKAAKTIKRTNCCIRLMEKDEFTIEDLLKKYKEIYPKWTPEIKALHQYLKWPKVNAEKLGDNGKYRRISQRSL